MTAAERAQGWLRARLSSSGGGRPRVLWIGCVEQVPPIEAIRPLADDVLVHGSLASALGTDVSGLALLEYAVLERRVSHVVICGHDDCDGVRRAAGRDVSPIVAAWLQPVRADLPPPGDRPRDDGGATGWLARSCARNVARQVLNVES